MLKSLLTPLRTGFNLSTPRTSATDITVREEENETPEDFARDAMIDLMRFHVEELRVQIDSHAQSHTLAEILKVLAEEYATKEVFRVLDGFLCLMNILNTLNSNDDEAKNLLKLIFVVLNEALKMHHENQDYFKMHVGWDSLHTSLWSFLSDARFRNHVSALLLSLLMSDFALYSDFESGNVPLQSAIEQADSRQHDVRNPGALRVLFQATSSSSLVALPLVIFLDKLLSHNHWNIAQMHDQGLVPILFTWLEAVPAPTTELADSVVKVIPRLLEVGLSTRDFRLLCELVAAKGQTLDSTYLDILKSSARPKWPRHFALRKNAAIEMRQNADIASYATSFTFMTWFCVEAVPTVHPLTLFCMQAISTNVMKLCLRADRQLEVLSSTGAKAALFAGVTVKHNTWTHVAIVYTSTPNSSLSLYIDGNLASTSECTFSQFPTQNLKFTFGDNISDNDSRWCLSTASFLTISLDEDKIRFIQHLGPRYHSKFQTQSPIRLLTYESITSLTIHLAHAHSKKHSSLLKDVLRHGLRIPESAIVFLLTPPSARGNPEKSGANVADQSSNNTIITEACLLGHTVSVRVGGVDDALWEAGGPSVGLQLIHLAENPRDFNRSLIVLTEALNASWKNSEEMEQMHGFEILADILQNKAHLFDIDSFKTVFQFLGCNFRVPEQSLIKSTLAYRLLALNFTIWSHTSQDVQVEHLRHFHMLLKQSRHARFNAKHKLAKVGIVRRMLFVLQTSWYRDNMLPSFADALQTCIETNFSIEDAVKPTVSYLAATLHEEFTAATSPQSFVSKLTPTSSREKATLVLASLVNILCNRNLLSKFVTSLPFCRTSLLLLGDAPTSAIATQVLLLLKLALSSSSSYIRKMELVNGWLILRHALPSAWSASVHAVAFDIMLGPSYSANKDTKLGCPQIFPAILASFIRTLDVATSTAVLKSERSQAEQFLISHQTLQFFLDELITVHSSNRSFRDLFKAQQTVTTIASGYRVFVDNMEGLPVLAEPNIRNLEKFNHLILLLALDTNADDAVKHSFLQTLEKSQRLCGLSEFRTLSEGSSITHIGPELTPQASPNTSSAQDRTFDKAISRIREWRAVIIASERRRFAKNVQDLREQHRQLSSLGGWRESILLPPGLWGKEARVEHWKLDLTEGPFRVRKRLEPDISDPLVFNPDAASSREVTEVDDTESIVRVEVPPWAEDAKVLSGDGEDDRWIDNIVEDKHRRIRHALQAGDVIEAVYNVTRMIGVDAFPSLFILGKTSLYIFDGFVETESGELVDARDIPGDSLLHHVSVTTPPSKRESQRWSYEQCFNVSRRTCLFRDVALEIYFRNCQNVLIAFPSQPSRQLAHRMLEEKLQQRGITLPKRSSIVQRTPLLGRMSAKVVAGLGFEDEVSTAQRRWQAREISNFSYLSILNQASGRTPSDATQYPVFPWILADYHSNELDLKSPTTFRDLGLPMGALTPARREAAESRYSNLLAVGEDPFHYGTHFSSAMIVCHFLIRLEPFTHMFKTLQGGDWDLPDRLFSDVARSYESAAQDIRGDVRELIGEFFTCPEFLENASNHDFGVQQSTGQRIHHVVLPPWARNDPLLFIHLHRQALESDHVSENLHKWIDLIWGNKQRDKESFNCFHPLSYEGSIDLDRITDELERKATVGIIHNFGQTPRKLFETPHPQRNMRGTTSLPLGTEFGAAENAHLFLQSAKAIQAISEPIEHIALDMIGEKIVPSAAGLLHVPNYPHEHLDWRHLDGSLRYFVDKKLVQVMDQSACSCASFADSELFTTGSPDGCIRMWRISRTSKGSQMICRHVSRGHEDSVNCIAACKAWSMVVSGGKDGKLCFWDLNTGRFLRCITFGESDEHESITSVSIMESTGYVAACSAFSLRLFTINGRDIAQTRIGRSDQLHCLTFLEREYSWKGVLASGGDDGTILLRTWAWQREDDQEGFQFEVIRSLKCRDRNGGRIGALRFVGETLYCGDEMGRVFAWELPD